MKVVALHLLVLSVVQCTSQRTLVSNVKSDSLLAGIADTVPGSLACVEALTRLVDLDTSEAAPSSTNEALSRLQSMLPESLNILNSAAAMIEANFTLGRLVEESTAKGQVPKRSPVTIYPKRRLGDAPYSVPEQSLLDAIYIPASFSYGQKMTVILVPGTGVSAASTYTPTYGQLLHYSQFDYVWINVPKQSLADAQITAEYVAYAINWVSSVTSRNVGVITFSQGSINMQWALKYWPSTRDVVTDFVALSPDFRGTTLAQLLCPKLSLLGCTPSILQQFNTSQFIAHLRAEDGGSAYVPTTTVYSATDEIVQPQSGKAASGIIGDVRGVGVSNTEIQSVCFGTPAGTFATHEGMTYNALAFALAIDALTNDGPGDIGRIDLKTVCSQLLAPGLGLANLLEEEAGLVLLAKNFLSYRPRAFKEPSIRKYAV